MLQNRPDVTISGPPAAPPTLAVVPEVMPPPRGTAMPAARWLEKYVPFLVVIALVAGYEKVASPEYKLSGILGAFEGNSEAASLRAKLDATQQMLAMQNAENARMQNEVAQYKAEMENTVNQYKAQVELQKQALAARLEAVIKAQQGKFEVAQMADVFSALLAAGGNQADAAGAKQFGDAERRSALAAIDAEMPNGAGIGTDTPMQQTRPVEQAAAPPAPALRLARVGSRSPQLLVRSIPQKDGSTVLCVLPAGAVVQLLGQSARDPAHDITFVQVGFNRQGYGNMTGWISQWSLEDMPASSPEGSVPQVCREPM